MRTKWPLVLALLFVVGGAGSAPAADQPLILLRGSDGRGQPFDLLSLRGRVVAITFCSRWTKDEAATVHDALLGRDVPVVSVVDFAGVPGFARGYARRKLAEHDQFGRIVHLVDEQGYFKRAFQVDPEHNVDIIVIDRDGTFRGRFCGRTQLDAALHMVDALRAPSARL